MRLAVAKSSSHNQKLPPSPLGRSHEEHDLIANTGSNWVESQIT